MEKITILISHYNRSQLLVRVLDSLEGLIENGLLEEIIVTDDGSSQEHLDILRSLKKPVRCLFSNCNTGLGANVNRGIKEVKTKYVLQLQDDFIFTGTPEDIRSCISIMDRYGEICHLRLTHSDLLLRVKSSYMFEGCSVNVYKNDGKHIPLSYRVRPYSDQPHIKRMNSLLDLGYYIEGEKMFNVEVEYQKRIAEQFKWYVAQFYKKHLFIHIGEDYSFNENNSLNNSGYYRLLNKFKLGALYRPIQKIKSEVTARLDYLYAYYF